jgi:hypothetical protein
MLELIQAETKTMYPCSTLKTKLRGFSRGKLLGVKSLSNKYKRSSLRTAGLAESGL